MRNRKLIYFGVLFLFILALILGGIIFYQKNNWGLEVIFLDVGQGDAILIQQGSNQILIDGGKSGKLLLEKLGRHIPFWDRNIEVVLATHPDQDHIGGLVDALKSYKIQKVIKTKAESESQTYKVLAEEIKNENPARNAFGMADADGAEIVEAVKGVNLKFPNDASAEIIYPFASVSSENAKDSNANSAVVKLNFGENSFLFTGDLPSEQEGELLKNNIDVKADILKVGHHGSKYSTSDEFLAAVKPEDAIISVGKNNSYGHPAPEALNRIMKNKIKIFRTDEMGDIIYKCKAQGEKCITIAN